MTQANTPNTPSTFHEMFPIGLAMVVAAIAVFGLGLPLALVATHGFDFSVWPAEAPTPWTLLQWLQAGQFLEIYAQYLAMFEGRHAGLVGGGNWHFWAMAALTLLATAAWLMGIRSATDNRDPSGQLGSARWANEKERGKLNRGLEIGLDKNTGRSVRLSTEGNLLSIAPPRAGKTSGLIINNLLVPDKSAWDGPCVVLDPKGDIHAAVARRRKDLGRRVIKFDLSPGAEDSDCWNPLERVDISNIAHLQTVASVLIPNMGKENSYFGVRGIDIFVGATAAALEEARARGRTATPADVAALLADHRRLLGIAYGLSQKIFKSVIADLELDERSRDQLLSTARTAVQWLQDERFQRLTTDANFVMDEIADGEADLFLLVPKQSATLLAPLLRWMFTELFAAINRRGGAAERIVMFVDEADSLGRFDDLRTALTLMPGRGLSVWTFWQSFSQIEEHYGRQGADTFRTSASVTTVSNISQLSGDAERISKALGDFTLFVDGTSSQSSASGQSSGASRSRQARPLMKPEELTNLESDELIALLNLEGVTRHPMRLRKIRYFQDKRFHGLHDDVAPVARL